MQYIDTTINVKGSVRREILQAAEETGVSHTRIIVGLLNKILKGQYGRRPVLLKRISYQKRDSSAGWKALHLYLTESEYEYFQDFRKFFKFSISFLVADVVQEFLDDYIKELLNEKDVDNYPLTNYIFIGQSVDNVQVWTICWGVPEIGKLYLE